MKINEILGYKGYYLNMVSCKGDSSALKELKLATLHPPVEVLLKMADGRVLQLLTPRAEELLRHLRMGGCAVENQN